MQGVTGTGEQLAGSWARLPEQLLTPSSCRPGRLRQAWRPPGMRLVGMGSKLP